MKGIRKTALALGLAIVMGFVTAVGLCMRALYAPQPVFAAGNALKIVLDAGHGGIDGGVTGRTTGARESDINLSLVFALKSELEDMGFAVTLTRKTEAGLYDTTAKGFKKRDMQKRKEIIEEVDPALVISIHQNYYPSRSLRGAQVFYGQRNERSKTLAGALQARLNAAYETQGVKNRKIMYGEYFMLECAAAPSVIVECGFLSNDKDEELLTSSSWQKTLAKGIAAGVMDYFTEQTA